MRNKRYTGGHKRLAPAIYGLLLALSVGACTAPGPADLTRSGLHPSDFEGTVDSLPCHLYVISNKAGMEACITNYGARLVSLLAPDREGHLGDVVLGFASIDDYTANSQNFGAVVGRYIGRILGAEFTLEGETYSLQRGGNGHCAHGGNPNYAARMWQATAVNDSSLTLNYLSPDGENGFPGNLDVYVTYTLTHDNALRLQYRATTDRPTVINLTNHAFFNLNGDPTHEVTDQLLTVNADSITAYDEKKCVTGEYIGVSGTAFDFRTPQVIGLHIDDDDPQLNVTGGYDHCWTIGASAADDPMSQPQATITDPSSGRTMEVYTTEPGLHIYTANGLKGNLIGKDSIPLQRRTAVCFETCHFQNSPNLPQFPSTALLPGETFSSTTVFKFK